ncbi:fungal cellulose binding domain-containing protein [Sodiomyces alkalinus F11]|uniref:Fungal cellulose binding domain-containing protein n=1 Tax=Sodiomyces alkalinus (strain CBS 110278 / VKM F-3762 / F11) TaxID=1314773 RepID=A0A3N2PUW6_SODAK|nr:fungal cellulose binding domain-containing protein [Sodiomyces alkalinus F11]ROT38289.1 fungal cellulose binding domain-containing protein [Sodiomyces alkalinus F11]
MRSGDSYSQTGFNIDGAKPSPSNPIGNPPLPGWTASGGLNWSGFMPTHYNASTLLTYNLAYGGATTDADLVTPYRPDVLSFEDQVDVFTSSLGADPRPDYAPWTAENTIVGVWIGVNDVGNTFWLGNKEEVITNVVDRYFELVQDVYDAGARNFVLLTVPPTDRSPMFIANNGHQLDVIIETIDLYNELLESRHADFQAANEDATTWLVDTAGPFNEALDHPTEYGSPDALCENSDGTSCLWFDSYHPGVAINRLVAEEVANVVGGPFFKGPLGC